MAPKKVARTQTQRVEKNRRRELSPTMRAYLKGRHDAGESYGKISHTTGVPKTTIQSIVAATHQIKYKSARPGRPRETSIRTDRAIVRAALSDRRQTLGELSVNVGGVSRRTIQRRLREADIKKWRAAQRPLLEPEIAAKRLAWAIAHKDWTEEQWLKVNWSDECSVEKSSGAKPTWVFRTPGDKWKKVCIAPKKKFGAVSQMVWVCFAGVEKGPMVDMV